jgi:carboxyl-terminal processing protease
VLDAETGQVSVARMERADVRLDLVTWERAPEALAVRVRIAAFDEGVSEELETILREMEEETVKGLVLDLRNNTGGLVEEAVGVTSQFLAAGNVLLTTDSQGRSTAVPVRGGGRVVDTPMVVLVNGATGNAAEIVTGALQDHERATVVGTATVGGGAVMDQFTLSDGSVLLIPVEAWLTPDGRAMWPQGLSPDIEVPLPATAEPVIEPRGPAMTKEQLQGSGDTQLIRALELLDTGRHRAVAQRELVRLARPLASPADRRAACRDPAGAHGAGLGSEAGGSAPVRGAQQGRGS